jgi:predicted nucleic acid-binding protein
VSGFLLDVNSLLGCGWKTHADHTQLLTWLIQLNDWATCPMTESGFMRISMSVAYRASFEDARRSLATLRALSGHRFLTDDIDAALLPVLTSYKDTTDAHLVTLAKRHQMKFATLDGNLIAKSWAVGIAENPLLSIKTS